MMTYAGGVVSWQSRLQKVVALSTTEAEYMGAVEAGTEIIWMKEFIRALGIRRDEFQLHYDNQNVIHLVKHIQRRYHWLQERVEEKDFVVMKIHTDKNSSNMLTKVFSAEKPNTCRQRVELVQYPMPE